LVVNEGFKKMAEYTLLTKNFKKWVFELVDGYLSDVAGSYGEKWKGNATILNFSQDKRIIIDIQEYITFDERLKVAQTKIGNCMKRWSDGAQPELQTLVLEAFRVDKRGNVDTKLILGLKKYKFQDAEWIEAMNIIAEAVMTTGSKSYIRFASKNKATGGWINHPLNFTAIEVYGGQHGND